MKDRIFFNHRGLLVLLMGLSLIIASFVLSRQSIDFAKFTTYGYLGVFLASLIGSATLFFPVPHAATVVAAGILFNPIGVAIAGGLGGTIGELVGYYFGRGGGPVAEFSKWYPRINRWVNRYGGLSIFLLAFLPNPFFDLAGITAGLTRYNFFRFIVFVFMGRTLRSLLFAYFGSSLNLLRR